MNVLQDFLTLTKGSCYVVGLIVLLVFIPFWLFLTQREEE
jgi:hypothetical protein